MRINVWEAEALAKAMRRHEDEAIARDVEAHSAWGELTLEDQQDGEALLVLVWHDGGRLVLWHDGEDVTQEYPPAPARDASAPTEA